MVSVTEELKKEYVDLVMAARESPTNENIARLFSFQPHEAAFPMEVKSYLSGKMKQYVLQSLKQDVKDWYEQFDSGISANKDALVGLVQQSIYNFYDRMKRIIPEKELDKYFTQDMIPRPELLDNYFLQDHEVTKNGKTYKITYLYLLPITADQYVDRLYLELVRHASMAGEDKMEQEEAFFHRALLFHSALRQNQLCALQAAFNYPPTSVAAYVKPKHLETREQAQKRADAEERINASKDVTRFVVETEIECRKCHKHTVIIQQKQLRSADEATATIYICTNCGYRKVEQ